MVAEAIKSRRWLRIWFIITGVWVVLAGPTSCGMIAMLAPNRFQYVYEVKDGTPPWIRDKSPERVPIYDVMRSPSAEKRTPEFRPTNHEAYLGVSEWNKHVDENPTVELKMPDNTELRLSTKLSQADRDYLIEQYQSQMNARYGKWIRDSYPWAIGLILPPLCLLAFMWLGKRVEAMLK